MITSATAPPATRPRRNGHTGFGRYHSTYPTKTTGSAHAIISPKYVALVVSAAKASPRPMPYRSRHVSR